MSPFEKILKLGEENNLPISYHSVPEYDRYYFYYPEVSDWGCTSFATVSIYREEGEDHESHCKRALKTIKKDIEEAVAEYEDSDL